MSYSGHVPISQKQNIEKAIHWRFISHCVYIFDSLPHFTVLYISGNKRKRKEADYIFVHQRCCSSSLYKTTWVAVLSSWYHHVPLWDHNIFLSYCHILLTYTFRVTTTHRIAGFVIRIHLLRSILFLIHFPFLRLIPLPRRERAKSTLHIYIYIYIYIHTHTHTHTNIYKIKKITFKDGKEKAEHSKTTKW